MNAAERIAERADDWAGILAGSGSVVHLGGESLPLQALLARGRARWQAHRACRLPALRGIGDADMLSLLLAAIVDHRPALLCAADALPPAPCDTVIGTASGMQGIDADRAATPPPAAPVEWPDGLVVLSSGTLGTPKLIRHAHDDVLATAAMALTRLGLAADDRVLITVPLHHMYGLGAALLPALLAGADVHLLPKANLLGFNDALRTASPTWIFSTPHLLRTLVQRKHTPVPGCRGLVLAGDGIPPSLHAHARELFGRVFDLYGSSELGVIAISDANQPQALRPLDGVHVFPADAAQGTLVAVHPHPATHILHQGACRAVPREWDTRDIATFHDDGSFEIRGRADLSLNRAGKLLVLADLERTIMAWPGVELAVALVLEEDTVAGKGIAVAVQPSSPALTIEHLKQHAADTLPVFARPDRYVLAAELPRLGSGKPDRNTITKDYRHG